MERKPETKREIVKKPPEWFKPNNPRKQFDDEADRLLGVSCKARQLHPVLAKPDGTIIDGERRVRGAKLVGLETLDAIIIEDVVTDTELRLLQAATVFHRADWTPGEKYECFYELIQRNSWQAKELAEHLHIDAGTICKLLSFGKTIPPVREALKAGNLSMNDGYAFSQLPEAEQAELLPKRLAGEIANREEMVREVKARKKARTNGHSDVKRFSATLPSGNSASFVGPMGCVSDLRDAARELSKLADKATKEGIEDLHAFQTWLRAKDK